MPDSAVKYKILRSVAHNFAHSFVSAMNYWQHDYVMSHLVRVARSSGESCIRIDFLTGKVSPAAFQIEPVVGSVRERVQWFPRHVRSSGADLAAVHSATLTIQFDLASCIVGRFGWRAGALLMPFRAELVIDDDRGRSHSGVITEMWPADAEWRPPSFWRKMVWRVRVITWRIRGQLRGPIRISEPPSPGGLQEDP